MTPPDFDALTNELNAIDGVEALRGVSGATLCTYRVGGPIAVVALVDTWEGLAETCSVLSQTDLPTLPIGKGSNLLVADRGFPGVAIQLGNVFTEVDVEDATHRVVAGGCLLYTSDAADD